MAELEDNTYTDPFSPEVAPGLSLIVLMRIYDAQMALLTHFDPAAAAELYDLHQAGGIVGSLPSINLEGDHE